MRKFTIIFIVITAFGFAAFAAIYNQDNFSAGGRMYEPVPEGHKIGKDNAQGVGFTIQEKTAAAVTGLEEGLRITSGQWPEPSTMTVQDKKYYGAAKLLWKTGREILSA